MDIVSPIHGERVASVDVDTAESIARKLSAARGGQPTWAKRPLADRIEIMERFKRSLAQDAAALAKITAQEMGKPILQGENEVRGLIGRMDFFIEHVGKVIRDEVVHRADGLLEKISHEPLGTVGNISAWNYPYFVGGNVFVPALLAGCAVLYKPSELATMTGLALTERLHAAGVPGDVFQTVVGAGPAGAALAASAVDGLFFTGSYATGQHIYEAASKNLTKVQLELGGKDPAYVTEDFDAKAAAEATADGATFNAGQSCCAVERIYVHEKVYEEFMRAFMPAVAALKMGDPLDPTTTLGPLARSAQPAFLEAQVNDAVKKGAKLLVGGKRAPGKGNFFPATVLTEVNHSMDIMVEESFGPVIGIMKVSSDAQAAALMRDTKYGLTASVYCRNVSRAEELLSGIAVGSAYINCCDRVSARLPWSGRGRSGLGTTLSTYGIQTFTSPKAWHVRGASVG